MNELTLEGIDGSNPLGFLAAVGTLCSSVRLRLGLDIRLYWQPVSGLWKPIISGIVTSGTQAFSKTLSDSLEKMRGQPALAIADDLVIDFENFRTEAQRAQIYASPRDRIDVDFLAAFGNEATRSKEKGRDRNIQDTALRTMSGAGHQHFLGFMRDLIENTREEHLFAALFQNWSYTESGPSLRWDPNDDRRYALRWKEPSGDPVVTVRGANRLAIEALPLLPTAPLRKKLETTGFTQRRGAGVFWTWPIWTTPIGLDPIRSLLALSELQKESPDRKQLAARGITEIFRSQRLTVGKYRNFTPALPV